MAGERSGALIRVSSGAQDAALQRASILKQARIDGREIIRWYELDGKSAFHGEQEAALADALADAKMRYIRALYCFNTDRVDRRGIRYTLQYRHEIMQAGAVLVSTTQPYCAEDTPEAEERLADDAKRARQESAIKQLRQNELVIPEIRANGSFFGKAPFGYEIVGERFHKQLVPTDIGREWIPQIFERIKRGDSLSVVCWWLDSIKIRVYPRDVRDKATNEIKHRRGDAIPWWPATLMQLIRNTVYIGHVATDAGEWVHDCEALVDATLFREANEALTNRARKQRGPRGNPDKRAMLRSAITCPRCGSPMRKNQATGDSKNTYYQCRGGGPAQKGCGNNVSMPLVDSTVNEIMAVRFHVPLMMWTLVRGIDHQPEIDALDLEFRQLASRGLSRDEYRAEQDRIWSEQDTLAALPVEDDHWELTATPDIIADLYAAEPVHNRGEWMKAHGITVKADKHAVTVSQVVPEGVVTDDGLKVQGLSWTEEL